MGSGENMAPWGLNYRAVTALSLDHHARACPEGWARAGTSQFVDRNAKKEGI